MLNTDIKRKIDGARQILVGKVPDPKAQVEQITTALIYKFMDDMDKESVELGGKIRFFTKEYEKYAWSKIIDPRLGGLERLNLYAEAITLMQRNSLIPQLFRDIFKDAFLPYRDPETLSLFLKEINGFSYDHSEDLGNAFEYLLSILGSQGDAGQFRTPRHIIDFIVELVHPTKEDKVLDPACGTAGFLISAYKNILAQHDGLDTNGKKNEENPLTPAEKKKLMNHFYGYDISPDMVRLSLVNLYLHGFPDPKVHEYDTLTSEEKWDETFDVILANPPFMSPKGGIRPHKRFSVKANRSEVLFVDYILEHLNSSGRAGVIVPDGIVSNPSVTYVKLRELMLKNGLNAVISLHQYMFKPYAGAKTSILLFDKKNPRDTILFAKVDNDGFELGEQRRAIELDDLPDLEKVIKFYQETGDLKLFGNAKAVIVDKKKLETKFDLFPNNYLQDSFFKDKGIEMVPLGELFSIEKGSLQSSKNNEGEYNFITASETWSTHSEYSHDSEALIFAMGASGSLGRTHYVNGKFIASDLCFILTPKDPKKPVDMWFYHALLNSIRTKVVAALAKGVSKLSINRTDFANYKVPYPKIDLQKKLGKEIKQGERELELLSKEIKEKRVAIDNLVHQL